MEEQQVDGTKDEQVHKKRRHRKKQLYNSILSLMEFYFSDSNLSKDRYLGKCVKENPFVNLDIFLKFNKIRKLTASIEDIQKAVKNSNLLELSEDKNSVCRKHPLKEKLNIDECTIYVERIKSDVTHDWLKQLFSEFGSVDYISLPKYNHNKANKGFAFIEFENESEAQKALNYFENIGLKMPSQTTPEELCSIATFENDVRNLNKRKFDEIKEESDEQVYKKPKIVPSEIEEPGKKKKKQKKKKNYFKELGLQVLSKKDWKKMRNRYLELQRKKMKEFKQHLNRAKYGQTNNDKLKKCEESESVKESIPNLGFIPSVIVKINLNEPCQDSKKLKVDIKNGSSDVKYVDIPLPAGSEEIFVRFNDSLSAKEFCCQEHFGKKVILEGEEEQLYWNKIRNDRSVQLNRENKKQRGRDKLMKKASKEMAKHIKFDE